MQNSAQEMDEGGEHMESPLSSQNIQNDSQEDQQQEERIDKSPTRRSPRPRVQVQRYRPAIELPSSSKKRKIIETESEGMSDDASNSQNSQQSAQSQNVRRQLILDGPSQYDEEEPETEQQKAILHAVHLPPGTKNWIKAFDWFLRKFNVGQLLKLPIRTLQYVPNDARGKVRDVYKSVFQVMDQVKNHESLHHRFKQLLASLPAMILPAVNGSDMKAYDVIRNTTTQFLEGKWETLMESALTRQQKIQSRGSSFPTQYTHTHVETLTCLHHHKWV